MIDLHSHLLPGVDDGSRSVSQSVGVLEQMSKEGIQTVCLTPHLTTVELTPAILEERLSRDDGVFRELSTLAPPAIALARGVELMLDSPFTSEMALPARIRLGGSRYLLVEFPHALSSQAIRGLIAMVVEKGLVPVVAHPERYPACSPADVFSWRDLGCAIQVDATTLVANVGARGNRARALVGDGLADIVAADNHGDNRTLRSAWDYLVKQDAELQAERLLKSNPAAVLADETLESVPQVSLRRGFMRSIVTAFRRNV
jgi:protein-tyrosine phosphatase